MTRNIERRVEIACPIYDPELRQELRDIFDMQWHDNVKARVLDRDLKNIISSNDGPELRSQYEIYRYLKEKNTIEDKISTREEPVREEKSYSGN
jgi:polyphosphate kinase